MLPPRWRLPVYLCTVLLSLAAVFLATSNHAEIEYDWDRLKPADPHPYSREAVAHGVKLPYHKTRQQCYSNPDKQHTAVITVLLPHVPGQVPVIASRGIERVLQKTPADVIFFHTGWTEQDISQHIRPNASYTFTATCVANVDWSTGHNAENWEFVETGYHGPGYRSMCRWYSRRVFNALHTIGYQWVIRLDADSQVPTAIQYNLVDMMVQHKAQYGFRTFDFDHPRVTHALPEAFRLWVVMEKLDAGSMWISSLLRGNLSGLDTMSSVNYDQRIIFNNFFVTNVTWWMEPRVQGWLKYLEMLRGYHKFRWGDAPVHTFTTGMFLKKDQLLEFDFDYVHATRFWLHGSDSNGTYGPLPGVTTSNTSAATTSH